MSDFRLKFLGLAALTTVFAGISFGQTVNCSAAAGGTQTTNPTSPILVRAESEADLVSDVVINCPGSAAVSNGQLTVFASLPVTSKAVVPAGLAGTAGNSEALLTVIDNAAVTTLVYQGTVAGSVVTFSGVNFPANFTATVSNIRVNATGAAVGSTPVPVTESIFAGTNGLATYVQNNITVGYALKSLVTPALVPIAGTSIPNVQGYVVCQGNPETAHAAASLSFAVVVGETFGGFFKTQTGGGVIQNGEQGSVQNGANAAIGTAASGTEISLSFANLPSVGTVYLPTSLTVTPTAAGTVPYTLTATGNPTAVTGLAGLTGAIAGLNPAYPQTYGGFAAYTPTSGSLTVTYQVTASSQAQVESFAVPVYVAFSANAATAQGPITVLEAYAPAAVITGQATSIPTFAPTTNSPLNGSAITLCQTSLLFPFVTNQSGFDTGIVLANTSTDPFTPPANATPQAGTCALNFYGAGAPTPSTGVAAPGGSQATGTTNAFLLSSVAPGFQGYVIAQCNYLYGHGFAYIAYDLTQNNGTAMGYLAEVILARPAAAPATEALNN